MRSLNAQINFMLNYERHELEYLPKAVADGDMSQADADTTLANVRAIIQTLRHAHLRELTERSEIRQQGFDAGRRGASPDSHDMNEGAATLVDWRVGYKKGAGVRQSLELVATARPTPHHAPASAQRIDARQAAQ